jgi:hypothetical protein
VTDFYQLLTGSLFSQPTKKELEQAKALIAEHGLKKAKAIIPRIVKKIKEQWPEAKTFGAIRGFVPEASTYYDRDEHRKEREQQEQIKRQREKENKDREQKEIEKIEAEWKPVWEALADDEREEIRAVALSGPHQWLVKIPRLAERRCLFALARQRGANIPVELDE